MFDQSHVPLRAVFRDQLNLVRTSAVEPLVEPLPNFVSNLRVEPMCRTRLRITVSHHRQQLLHGDLGAVDAWALRRRGLREQRIEMRASSRPANRSA